MCVVRADFTVVKPARLGAMHGKVGMPSADRSKKLVGSGVGLPHLEKDV